MFVAAYLYSRWSTKWSLVGSIAVTLLGLLGVLRLELAGDGSPVLPVALLIVGTNGIIAILLPYAAESFPLRVRGRATGWVAACTKAGGMIAQLLASWRSCPGARRRVADHHRADGRGAGPGRRFGKETRGRDLRDLDPDGRTFAATGV